ncbi:MAG: V4R domain-containing protein [Elusimicrobiota bacterium]
MSLLLGYFEGVIEMPGKKAVLSRETKCAAAGAGYCEYEVEWN